MDVKRNFQIEGCWIPTTPAKPSVAQSQPICEDKLENQDSHANFLESGRVLHGNHIDQANWQESDILSTGFLEESRINGVVASCDTTSFIDVNKRLDIWEEGFRWSNIPFGDLLALADAATSSTSAPATSIPVSTSAPANSSMADNNQSLENSNFVPDIHQHGFSIPSRPSFDLNSPPQMTTAEVLRESVSSKFAPETPDQARRAGRNQVSEIRNSGIEERTNQARDEQVGEIATEIVEGNELLHEIEQSQLHKDQSCAAVSTHLQEEDHNPDKGGNQGTDLNKKPRRKRHRPKVVIEGKPSKARNPRTPKPDGPTETPRVKRKYVRKKGLEKPPATPSEVTSGNTNPKTVESTEKSCRRSLNFDFESQVRDESSSGQPPSNIDSESLARNLGTKVQSTVQLGEGMQVRVDSRQVGIAYDVTRSMNAALKEYLSMPERLVPNPPTPSKTDDTLRDKLMADAQNACARGKCRIVFSDETHDKLMTDAQNVCTRGKCRIVYSDKTHDKEASNVQMIINTNTHSAPRSQIDSNCSCSACLTQGKQARGLKRGHSSITDEVQLTSMNATGSNYNSLRDYLANFPVNICSNATIPGMHFPAIYKKKRTEKMNSSAASSTLSTVTAAQNPVRQTMESSAQTKISSLSCSQEEQHSFKCMLALGHAEKSKKKRSKVPTRVRDLASLIGIVERIQLPTSSTRGATTSDVMQGFESSHQPHTCMEALAADTRATKATKKRTKRNSLLSSVPPNIHNHQQFLIKSTGPPRGMIWKGIDYIDALVERFRRLDINAKGKRVGVRKQNALIPYNMRYQEQNALVLYRRDGTVVPFEGSFDPIKKRRPRPKVDLDDETTRVWKLLLQDINSQGIDGTDEEKAKWWEEERRVFRGRADSFIARMHLVQGDRRFSMWKGSVVDSVVGVFLTQNVSDHLSSSAFMSLAARFPLKSNSNHGPSNEEKTTRLVQEPEVCVLDPEDTIGWHEEKSNQPACDQSSMTLQDVEYNEEKEVINSNESFGSSTDEVRSKDNPNSKLFDYSTNGLHIHESAVYRSATQITRVAASFMGDQRELDDVISSQTSVVSSQNSVDSSMAQTAERTGSCSQSNSEAELIAMSKPNSFGGPTSFLELLQKMAGTTMSNRVNNQESGNKSSSRKIGRNQLESMACESQEQDKDRSPMPPSNYHFHLTPNSRDLEVECFDMLGKESRFSGIPKKNEENCASEQSGLSAESASQATVQKIVTESSRGAPKSSIENNHPCDNLQTEMNKTFQSQRIAEEGSNIKSQTPENNRKVQQDLHVQNFSRETFDVTESTNTSKAKSTRIGKEKQIPVDWDSLRKQAQANGKREKAANTMDSVDWEAIRCADVNEIAHTIRERGMNNMLAERIKDFLNRLVRDHGSIDLEWLRDVPPDKAKEYLLSIRGLGLKSVECVRLLTLHHLAFPVDTNVGRIAVRLGWVPLQPLPESLQLHLLELYPILESIQKYLWPRLCKLDQRTLYELHYQMITFGKVFCTKSKPNCNACPMRGECRHFASAFASARLALPAPEEKSIVNTTENIAADQTHTVIVNRLQLPPPQANQQLEIQSEAINCNPIIEEPVSPEPIIEMPATPEPERIHISECDIEDTCEDPDEIPTCEDPDEIPTIKLNIEEFTQNLQNYMQQNMELQEGDVSKALVALTPEAASIPMPKLKNVSRLRTEHHVYELPDSHPLLEGLDKREPDDPCSYLLAIWTPGETAESIQPPEGQCNSQESGKLCDEETCFSCNNIREANSQSVRGTLLIPCRTAMRGSFPLNGTYFQVNEVFADHESSLNPIDVPRSWLWNLPRRTVYFGTSIPTIFKGLSTEGIQYCFWRGFVCVRGFDQRMRAPRPLMARLHFPASKLVRNKGKPDEN